MGNVLVRSSIATTVAGVLLIAATLSAGTFFQAPTSVGTKGDLPPHVASQWCDEADCAADTAMLDGYVTAVQRDVDAGVITLTRSLPLGD
ncbi:hypothetical protein [Acuticoccus sp.]|uniref:hypothetical protein n=1 Tax=Acuticoccus sp. TaxID=1904378 RepID=UPI003B527077